MTACVIAKIKGKIYKSTVVYKLLYKLKYWQGVNFGNWKVLDEIFHYLIHQNVCNQCLNCQIFICTKYYSCQ